MEKTNQALGREEKTNTATAHIATIKHHREPQPSWINAIKTRGKDKKNTKDLLTFNICASRDRTLTGCDGR